MSDLLNMLKGYAGMAGKALIKTAAPAMFQGVFIELISKWSLDVEKVTNWVEKDASLWEMFTHEQQDTLAGYADMIRCAEWLNSDWIIDTLVKDYPSVASLFLNWDEGHDWLDRQVEIIRRNINATL
jgi:hypothetical protein